MTLAVALWARLWHRRETLRLLRLIDKLEEQELFHHTYGSSK